MTRLFGGRLSFVAVTPAIVVVLGLATVSAIGWLGAKDLAQQSDRASLLRAELLLSTLAERLRATAEDDRPAVVERAARRSGTEMLLVRQDGSIIVDATLQPPGEAQIERLLVAGTGLFSTQLGRVTYWARPLAAPLGHLSLIVFVPSPETPDATRPLITSLAALATILVGVAALVAFALARDVRADVSFVRQRIAEMAQEDAVASGDTIPLRSIDEVGMLTHAFNTLVDRFDAAQRAYDQDLDGALAYDRDRSAFVAAVSHELRTPINAILGFTDILLSEVEGPLSAEAKEDLNQVRSSGRHLAALIDDILDLSALESGQLRLNPQLVDVFAVAGDVIRELQPEAARKQLPLRLCGSAAMARVDARRVRQVLTNIIGNAVKFTARGEVTVEVTPREGHVALLITDTGPGIPRSEQRAIFEEYRQSGELHTQRAGTGLGLAIARRLVGMHGGTIQVESEVGRGSSFAVVLPTEPPPTRPSTPPLDLSPSARSRVARMLP
jgi:signal transduction histidine kinase